MTTYTASAIATVTNVRRSWDIDWREIGRNVVRRHGEALAALSDIPAAGKQCRGD